MSTSISIALCTCNGERFLAEQLDSIRRQTVLPDELVACDDRSTDATLAILHRFAAEAPFEVRVVLNSQQLGIAKNFEQAIGLCRGDIIVLADQDDVWLPDKLALVRQVFDESASASALFTDAHLIDDNGTRLGRTLSEEQHYAEGKTASLLHRDRILDVLVVRNICTGATMALRSTLRQRILPFPDPMPCSIIHDAWIGLVAAVHEELQFVEAKPLLYRQHAQQQLGAALKPAASLGKRLAWSFDQRRSYIEEIAACAREVEQVMLQRFPNAKGTTTVSAYRQHVDMRSKLPASRIARATPIIDSIRKGDYRRFHNHGLLAAARDLTHAPG